MGLKKDRAWFEWKVAELKNRTGESPMDRAEQSVGTPPGTTDRSEGSEAGWQRLADLAGVRQKTSQIGNFE